MGVTQCIEHLFGQLRVEFGSSRFLAWHQEFWAEQIGLAEQHRGDKVCLLNLIVYQHYLRAKLDQGGGDVPYAKWLP